MAAYSPVKDEEEEVGVCFKDPNWLEAFPLNKDTALDYFSLSQFYDRTCNNELVKMQRLDMSKLSSMRGLEYILFLHQEPFLYVIRYQRRDSPKVVVPLATYYIINGTTNDQVNGTIFRAPNAHNVLSSRLVKSAWHAQQAFEECMRFARFDPLGPYQWNFNPGTDIRTQSETASSSSSSTSSSTSSGAAAAAQAVRSKEEEQRVREDAYGIDKVIMSLYSQFSPAAQQPVASAPVAAGARGTPEPQPGARK